MRIEAYFRVVGDEETIRSIQRESSLPGATIKETKSRKHSSGGEHWWNWQTPRTPMDLKDPDEGFRALLNSHKAIFPILKKYSQSGADLYLEVITFYQQGEDPSGLYISADTISLLGQMGAAFDNDVVMEAPENYRHS